MAGFLRQSTASQSRALGPFVSDSDFKTLQTGLTIANTDVKLVVNGGASANKNSGGGTHRVNGIYGLTFDATDTATVGELDVSVSVSGALVVFDKFTVLEEVVYDELFAASALGYVDGATVNVTKFNGTTVTARDIGASVLLSSGTGTGQLNFTSGVVQADAAKVNGVATSSVTTINANLGTTQPLNFTGTGASALVKTDVVDIAGSAVSASSAQLGVNVVNINAVSASAVTTVNANVGTTQPVNFTGTGGSALAKSDMVDIAGAAVSTSSAQIGVNVVNAAGTAWGSGAITAASIASNAITAAKIATDAIGASQLAADGATKFADALLKRDMSAVTGEASRSPLNALRFLRNLWQIVTGTLTVMKEDDTTTAWTGTVTQTAGNPVSKIDPS